MDFMKLALTLCLQTTVNLLSLVTQLMFIEVYRNGRGKFG